MSKLIKIAISKDFENKISYILKNKKINIQAYISDLIDKDINSKVYFDKGFYFHNNINKVFYENKQIDFSRVEFIIFKYLFDNRNKLVIYNELLEIIEINQRNNLFFSFG